MNIRIVLYFLGWVMNIEALFMLLPCFIALLYGESNGIYFLMVAVVCGGLGFLNTHKKPSNLVFYAKEGFVSVALSWIVLSFFGALPFYFSGEIPVFEDALFETISGFTTTGASILSDVEGLSQCMLIWRSFTHWIGGMGVLVFILAVMPLAGGYNMHIMRAESPGPSVGKLVPRVKTTAKILYLIYLSMTILQILILLVSGMPWFHAVALSFGTAGTGGFGLLNDSIASYTTFQQAVITVFMILFGINFNVYYLFLIKKPKEALKSEEARTYLGIILVSVLLITWFIKDQFDSIFQSLHHAAFQVGSVITTTGYSTVDFDLWSGLPKMILVCLMFIGACAGSTGGGIKVSRIIIAVKAIKKELDFLVHPRSIKILKMEGKGVEHQVLRSVNAFILAYIMIFTVSMLLVSMDNFSFTSTFTAIAATFNNIGPGLDQVGPTCNFGGFSALSKYVMMFDMLAGRLEIFPMLLLFSPGIWRKH